MVTGDYFFPRSLVLIGLMISSDTKMAIDASAMTAGNRNPRDG